MKVSGFLIIDFPWGIPCISRYGNIHDNKTWTILNSSHIKLITHDQYQSNLQPVIRLALLKPIHLYLLNKCYLKNLFQFFQKNTSHIFPVELLDICPLCTDTNGCRKSMSWKIRLKTGKNITQLTWMSKHVSLFQKNI